MIRFNLKQCLFGAFIWILADLALEYCQAKPWTYFMAGWILAVLFADTFPDPEAKKEVTK